ncbi:DcaP family trimeric outer membrane transporter [Bdellovibrio sp. ZAP7]|uniref:DcaP family trimeric outer membrane transporter n=1 Tax=Bdellovibrio sp. ZAP7 TaxID=2231053 RepID=UPI001AEF7389|nr:DcaP family trimeric outer membrane transporter [Bdellovibrio sp. ZAP7]
MNAFIRRALGIGLIAMGFASYAQAEAKLEIYGFTQLDYIQDFNRVDPKWQDTLRPSKIAPTDGAYGSDGQASLSAKQSRLGIQTWLPLSGEDLFTRLEFDFFGVGSDEGQTTPRLRHAYGQWGSWLAGQTNSLFMDGDIFPNMLDYWGPIGMAFYRNPQIRWTPMRGNQSLSIAIERPGDDIDPGQVRTIDPDVVTNAQKDEKLPDLTAQWKSAGDWGHFQIAGIVRQVGFETKTGNHEPSDSKTGWGVDVTGSVKTGSGKIMAGVVTGEGIASYMNDGGTDMGPEGSLGNLSVKVVPLTAFLVYYDHNWNEKLMSTIGFSQSEVKNTDLQNDDAFKRGQYASINLVSTPVKNFMYGGEFLWGSRMSKDDTTTHDQRIQITMKYSFSSLDFK